MPVVPFSPAQSQASSQGPEQPDDTWTAIATAGMHEQGRLFESEEIAAKKSTGDPAHQYIDNIEKADGLFEPVRDDMQGKYKDEANRAKVMTKKMYDLYKSGDAEVQATVKNWELKTLGAGYNDTEAGQALKKESIEKYGSKDTMSQSAIWEAFMSHYSNLIGDRLENDKLSDADRDEAGWKSAFDREGRTQMNMTKIYGKLRK